MVDYDLKKYKRQLYPVIVDKCSGKVIDGVHRLDADPNWRKEVIETKSEDEFLILRLQANLHRRTVPETEIRGWINELAEYYLTHSVKKGEIALRIAEEAGYSQQRVRYYLDEKYKLKTAPARKTLAASVSQTANDWWERQQAKEKRCYIPTETCPLCGTYNEEKANICPECWKKIEQIFKEEAATKLDPHWRRWEKQLSGYHYIEALRIFDTQNPKQRILKELEKKKAKLQQRIREVEEFENLVSS